MTNIITKVIVHRYTIALNVASKPVRHCNGKPKIQCTCSHGIWRMFLSMYRDQWASQNSTLVEHLYTSDGYTSRSIYK